MPFRGQAIAHLGDQRVVCSAGAISVSGMQLLAPQPAKLGFVRVTFQLDEGGAWLDVDALLVSQAPAGQAHSWSLQFQSVPPHVAALIARYVEGGGAGQVAGPPAQAPVARGGTQPGLRRVPTGPHSPVTASSPRSGVPTGPQHPAIESPARSGTQPLPPLRRVPTGPQFPVGSPPRSSQATPGSPLQFTAAPAPRTGKTQPSLRRVPVTASPAVVSTRRSSKPRQEADGEDGLSDLYAEAEEEAKKKEQAEKEKK